MSEQAWTILAAVIAAVISGGTMGGAVIAIANKLLSALIKQTSDGLKEISKSISAHTNAINANTAALEKHTLAIERLTLAVQSDARLSEYMDGEREKQLLRIETEARYAAQHTKELVDKLRGRL